MIPYKNETEVRALLETGNLIDAVKTLRDSNPISLLEAKNIVEAWRDNSPSEGAEHVLKKRIALALAREFWRGKLAGVQMDAQTEESMIYAAARQNVERGIFDAKASELFEMILDATKS